MNYTSQNLFVSHFEFIRSKLSNLSAPVPGVCGQRPRRSLVGSAAPGRPAGAPLTANLDPYPPAGPCQRPGGGREDTYYLLQPTPGSGSDLPPLCVGCRAGIAYGSEGMEV